MILTPILKSRSIVKVVASALILASLVSSAEYGAPCKQASDCWNTYNEKYMCELGKCTRPSFTFEPIEQIGLLLVFLISVLTSAAGLAGGTLILPVMMYFFNFSASDSIPISRVAVLACSAVTFLMMYRVRRTGSNSLQIDYELSAIITPLAIAGAEIGVVLAKLLPVGFVMIGFIMLMGYTCFRTYAAGIKEHKKEIELTASKASNMAYQELREQEIITTDTKMESLLGLYKKEIVNLLVIVLSVLVSSVGSLLRYGGGGIELTFGFKPCSSQGLMIFFCSQLINILVPVILWRYRDSRDSFRSVSCGKLRGHFRSAALLCYLIGIGGGLFGGSTFFLSTYLLALGTDPETITATIGNTSFWLAIRVVVQFFAMGGIQMRHGVWLLVPGILGSFLGNFVILWLVKKYNKPSVLIWAIFLLLAICLIAVPVDTIYRTLHSPREYYSFSTYC